MPSPSTLRDGIRILLTALMLPMSAGCGANPAPDAAPGPAQSTVPSPATEPAATDDPCESARYKGLLETSSFAAMGNNEYSYFVKADQACRQYRRTRLGDAFDVCKHAPYALVDAKALADMSDREYKYFVEVDPECAAQRQRRPPAPPQPEPPPPQKKSSTPMVVGILVVIATLANLVESLR